MEDGECGLEGGEPSRGRGVREELEEGRGDVARGGGRAALDPAVLERVRDGEAGALREREDAGRARAVKVRERDGLRAERGVVVGRRGQTRIRNVARAGDVVLERDVARLRDEMLDSRARDGVRGHSGTGGRRARRGVRAEDRGGVEVAEGLERDARGREEAQERDEGRGVRGREEAHGDAEVRGARGGVAHGGAARDERVVAHGDERLREHAEEGREDRGRDERVRQAQERVRRAARGRRAVRVKLRDEGLHARVARRDREQHRQVRRVGRDHRRQRLQDRLHQHRHRRLRVRQRLQRLSKRPRRKRHRRCTSGSVCLSLSLCRGNEKENGEGGKK